MLVTTLPNNSVELVRDVGNINGLMKLVSDTYPGLSLFCINQYSWLLQSAFSGDIVIDDVLELERDLVGLCDIIIIDDIEEKDKDRFLTIGSEAMIQGCAVIEVDFTEPQDALAKIEEGLDE
jgi:hypothetical protein